MVDSSIQATGRLDVSGADATRQLSSLLSDFSSRIGEERREVVVKQSLSSGIEAGQQLQQPRKNEFTLANQAFNQGLRSSYLAETDSDIRRTIGRLAAEHPLDPISFENGVLAMQDGLLKDVEDQELRRNIEANIAERGESAFLNISNAKRDHDMALSWSHLDDEINNLTIESQRFAADGDSLSSAISVIKAFDYLDKSVDSGLINLETADKRKRQIERDAAIEEIRFETRTDFETLDSFGKAMERLESKKPPNGFTEKEWINTKDQIESDLKSRISRMQLDEANERNLLKSEQDSNFNQVLIDLTKGDIDGIEIVNMAERGEITADQMNKALDRLSSKGRGVDSPEIENQIQVAISRGNLAQANSIVMANWGTNLTDGSARMWLAKTEQEGDSTSPLNTSDAKRFKKSLKTFIGFKDSMSGFFDPARQVRWGIALLKYDDAVLNGEDPRATMNRLVQDFTSPEERYEAMRNPRFGEKEDIKGSLLNLQKAFKTNNITKKEFDTEVNYIRKELIPAMELKNQYNTWISDNAKQIKATE